MQIQISVVRVTLPILQKSSFRSMHILVLWKRLNSHSSMLDKAMNTAPSTDENLSCPITSVLNLISAKWTVQILRELAIGSVRTRRFLKVIPGLSMKSLQERLKALQASGMITRQEFDEKIPRVEHTITERGRRLFSVMTVLKDIEAEITSVTCKCSLEGNSETEMDCPMRRAPKVNQTSE